MSDSKFQMAKDYAVWNFGCLESDIQEVYYLYQFDMVAVVFKDGTEKRIGMGEIYKWVQQEFQKTHLSQLLDGLQTESTKMIPMKETSATRLSGTDLTISNLEKLKSRAYSDTGTQRGRDSSQCLENLKMCHQNEVDQWLSQIKYKRWGFRGTVRTSDWLEPRREPLTASFYKEDGSIPEYAPSYRTVAVPRITINLGVTVPTIESIQGFPTTFTHAFVLIAGSKEKFYRDVFDAIVKVETHEAMEFFTVDRIQMFFPDHRVSPYTVPHPMQFTPKDRYNGEYKKVPRYNHRLEGSIS